MTSSAGGYDFNAIEARWQQYWLANKTFRTPQPGDPGFDPAKPKFYVLDMFPYPSGVGLHVGHPLGYIATDIYARFLRMRGYNVLHPMGYDAFGLPAEQYAVEHGVPPRETTQRNIDNMRSQMQRLGLGYDWDREIATTDVAYYKWTQWIFLQMYNSWFDHSLGTARPIAELLHQLENEEYVVNFDLTIRAAKGEGLVQVIGIEPGTRTWAELTQEERRAVLDNYRLAYVDEVAVNWCPALGTVLANEEVTNEGRSERGNHPVFRRPLRQWMLRITAYAERLEEDLDLLDWPEPIKLMQRNWIGRSEGAEVDFQVESGEDTIRVYTTRPDTLFGATYMVLAPEHELVDNLTTADQKSAVNAYVEMARNKSDLDRTADTKEKTGVFTGSYAINPVNGQRIPIWIADYVLMGYGTGAIMAVPAHDTRDFEFAQKFNLPIVKVVEPPQGVDWRGYTGDGLAVNSDGFNGLPTPEFKKRITAWLEEKELGEGSVKYKLRDWLFSRQRYWGEPFPIVHDLQTGQVYPLDESELPVELPELADFRPQASDDPEAPPAPPLGRATAWANVTGYLTDRGTVKLLRDGSTQGAHSASKGVPARCASEGVPARSAGEGDQPEALARDVAAAPRGGRSKEREGVPAEASAKEDSRTSDNSPPLAKGGMGGVELRHFRRELNTMPQWAGSCWYYLRYLDPRNSEQFVAPNVEEYWMISERSDGTPNAGGVDLYVGGAEHAVLHLLYARFWHKVLYDLSHVSTPEPFQRLFNQGYIQAYAYQDSRGMYVDVKDVQEPDASALAKGATTNSPPLNKGGSGEEGGPDFPPLAKGGMGGVYTRKSTGEALTRSLGKMGKSLKNAVAPDDIGQEYGTDTLRVYEMYMGPLEASKPWSTRDIIGMSRFLHALWRRFVAEDGSLKVSDEPADDATRRLLHKTIKRATGDMIGLRFNTAIAALIELNNALKGERLPREIAAPMLRLVSPIAPHLAEELWQRLQGPAWKGSIAFESWPGYEEALTIDAQIEIPVQLNGKLRSKILVAPEATQEQMTELALADPRIAQELTGRTVRKTIVVPGRMVNIVAN